MTRRYTGPAKPITTYREIISDKAEAIIFVLLAFVAVGIIFFME